MLINLNFIQFKYNCTLKRPCTVKSLHKIKYISVSVVWMSQIVGKVTGKIKAIYLCIFIFSVKRLIVFF